MSPITIIVVEDDPEVCRHLAETLRAHPQLELLATADSFSAGEQALREHQPRVLLTDLGLPDGSGIELIRLAGKLAPACEAMVISGFQDEHRVFEALKAGAKGYISKHDPSLEITSAVLSMLQGGAPISPVIARLMLLRFQPPMPESDCEQLTERETHILKLISHGFTSKEIGQKLNISYYTVTTHIKNIYTKLQVNSRTEALHEATRQGLLDR